MSNASQFFGGGSVVNRPILKTKSAAVAINDDSNRPLMPFSFTGRDFFRAPISATSTWEFYNSAGTLRWSVAHTDVTGITATGWIGVVHFNAAGNSGNGELILAVRDATQVKLISVTVKGGSEGAIDNSNAPVTPTVIPPAALVGNFTRRITGTVYTPAAGNIEFFANDDIYEFNTSDGSIVTETNDAFGLHTSGFNNGYVMEDKLNVIRTAFLVDVNFNTWRLMQKASQFAQRTSFVVAEIEGWITNKNIAYPRLWSDMGVCNTGLFIGADAVGGATYADPVEFETFWKSHLGVNA